MFLQKAETKAKHSERKKYQRYFYTITIMTIITIYGYQRSSTYRAKHGNSCSLRPEMWQSGQTT